MLLSRLVYADPATTQVVRVKKLSAIDVNHFVTFLGHSRDRHSTTTWGARESEGGPGVAHALAQTLRSDARGNRKRPAPKYGGKTLSWILPSAEKLPDR
jgi:hypothetical protein